MNLGILPVTRIESLESLGNILYGIQRVDGELWQIDVAAPANSVNLGSLPAGLTSAGGLGSLGNILYTIAPGHRELWQVDVAAPANSVNLGSLPAGLTNPTGLGSLPGVSGSFRLPSYRADRTSTIIVIKT